ncbi:insulin-like peptide 2 isoform X1 [Neodiprion pinetum]|uniref:LIRP n=1 Tax=Neodiprion lecontei TaxID=441921 RepID=A0A6J0BCB7_NEOLC|nr:LIRP isoform X1 [Neodiprion lecontei]XP_015511917.1 LIRP isoform X1 [Neodiprion lecontei]XP_046430660.1 LIRP isoform X1 [Neodiprion fabricii]XP_046430661.1 LIRP isoform X1 [Neodiprion fabricii]XP_046487601.1 LIRP isoform X1 [Neodiprion pinetum]XP_046487603.1 LIRP isoform X1 [Neodiprion pinetum]XP_046624327.1 LIRP isoform X1 [Neodiprion virginianus]XP_046624328.1 LIRP isoform X1 [Neodiprion virginianus]
MSTSWLNVVLALALAVALALPHFSSAQSDIFQFGAEKRKTLGTKKYCGKNLADALQAICDGVYFQMFKKGGQEMEMDDYNYGYDDSYPFRTRASANAMMGRFAGGRFKRQPRGVHDECCAKPCTVGELSSYCGR